MTFKKLTDHPDLLRAIEDKNFEFATDIQTQVIPVIQDGKDLIGQSQTGTGKTAAFAIPILEKIDPDLHKPQVIILTPTRELAVQVADEINDLARHMQGLRATAVYGGDPIQKQILLLKKGPQIVVGTPGRTMDHLRRRTIRFNHLHTIILDEADEMLKMGFREDIETILEDVTTDTQRLLFSATMPKAILEIAEHYLVNPVHVAIKPSSITTDTIAQKYVAIQKRDKVDVLYRLLDAKQPNRCLIFCNTKKMVDDLIIGLQERGHIAERIHGDMRQEQRMKVLRQFNKGSISILVATDVAARGLDIQSVDLVINYDLPDSEEYYVHRIGRSGRAGNAGESITILTYKDRESLKQLETFIGKKVEPMQVPSLKRVNELKVEQFVDDLLSTEEDIDVDAYKPIIARLKSTGLRMDEIVVLLLKNALNLHELYDERDLNDHEFLTPRSNKNKRNNRRYEDDRSKKPYRRKKGSNKNIGKKKRR